MVNALRRLQAFEQAPNTLPESMAAFGIAGGLPSGLRKLFASHPPLQERIDALRAG